MRAPRFASTQPPGGGPTDRPLLARRRLPGADEIFLEKKAIRWWKRSLYKEGKEDGEWKGGGEGGEESERSLKEALLEGPDGL